jgi:hypothetical protein
LKAWWRDIILAMSISRELWISNLMNSASAIGDTQHQQTRWLAPDAASWERPTELLCGLLDDCQLELFIDEQGPSLSSGQLHIAKALLDEATRFDVDPDGWRDPEEVLNDPCWEKVRQIARAFESVFRERS